MSLSNAPFLAIVKRVSAWRYFLPVSLSAAWGLLVLLAWPVGEFPENDTWAFTQPIKTLLETGKLELSDWPFMSLIAHIAWGYLVSSLFGFSHTILRFSVALLGLAGLWGLYALLLALTRERRTALLGTITLAVNPFYFHLACTFMTDVPFLSLGILSYLLLINGIRKENRLAMAAGILLAGVATLIRQVGLIIPVSFALAYLYKHRLHWRAWLPGILATAAVFGILAAYEHWLELADKTPLFYRSSESQVLAKLKSGPAIWLAAADTAMACFVYLGLFLLPVLIGLAPKISTAGGSACGGEWRSPGRIGLIIRAVILIAWTAGITIFLMHQGRLMPLRQNGSLFYDFGLGPPTLRDVFLLGCSHLPQAPQALMILLTAAGSLGGGMLLQALWRSGLAMVSCYFAKRQELVPAWASVMAGSAFVLYLIPLAILVPLDRYLLLCLPLLMVVLVCASPVFAVRLGGPRSFMAACLLLVLAVFAVGGTHDYFAWNRARWQALRELTEVQKIPPEKIDGGFEFNGLHFYDPHYASESGKSWWWVQDNEYVIAFAPFDNYMEVARHPYTRWIPPGAGNIFTLRRKNGQESDIILAATRKHGGNQVFINGDPVRYWSGDGRSAPVALSYGDYINLAPGRYVATIYYLARKPKRAYRHSWGQLRLVQFDNGPAITETEIEPVETSFDSYHLQNVRFSLEQAIPVEVQIIGGDARLWLYRVVFRACKEIK
ncbi:MAG: glycosyltransferase family 39 protein [Lentisphaerae bacterium]|nr:glycosyltransferase family 39 protein [Lentisphaerota bacterium]